MAARMRRKASDSGHPTPNPSPVQKVPKVVNMIPTTNFSEFSGTFDSGTRDKAPTRMAFFNHFNPKRSRRMPMTRRSASIGTHWTSATPKVATSRARVAAAADGYADDQNDSEGLHKLNGGGEKCGSSNYPLLRVAPFYQA